MWKIKNQRAPEILKLIDFTEQYVHQNYQILDNDVLSEVVGNMKILARIISAQREGPSKPSRAVSRPKRRKIPTRKNFPHSTRRGLRDFWIMNPMATKDDINDIARQFGIEPEQVVRFRDNHNRPDRINKTLYEWMRYYGELPQESKGKTRIKRLYHRYANELTPEEMQRFILEIFGTMSISSQGAVAALMNWYY